MLLLLEAQRSLPLPCRGRGPEVSLICPWEPTEAHHSSEEKVQLESAMPVDGPYPESEPRTLEGGSVSRLPPQPPSEPEGLRWWAGLGRKIDITSGNLLSVLLPSSFFCFFICLFVLWNWGLNSGLCACRAEEATTPVHFALLILEMESLELFAQAALEPQSSRAQPPK
jgi:hypothetical protein